MAGAHIMLRSIIQFTLCTLITAGLALAAIWPIRLGLADRFFLELTPESTQKAIDYMPERSMYQRQLGIFYSMDDPQRSRAATRRAVELNPFDARAWIELGLGAELDGDDATAERELGHAAEVDRGYLPRWALANYYFRKGDTDKFWLWSKAAAAMAYEEPTLLFRLCDHVDDKKNLLVGLELHTPKARKQYLEYLVDGNHTGLLGEVALAIARDNLETDTIPLLQSCDRLLAVQKNDEALQVWNVLAETKRVPFNPLIVTGSQNVITNGKFTVPPTLHGFDWHWVERNGIIIKPESETGGLRVSFSGRQPEVCEVLYQLAPVREETRYVFRYGYQTATIAPGTGLLFAITNPTGGGVLSANESLSSDAETQGQLSFTTPPQCKFVRLSLFYHRVLGTTRIEGSISLQNLTLTAEP